ncbi:MAG: DUF1178 family protein [Proteobacteria bacterium]|nr:DUF1178 family protein [Pseudomonadota bacterium]MDA1057482.1 DUF1178 family protein [Pseudomonadota bacterium]
MISFDLRCANAHVFEAWFSNSETYARQAKHGELVCPICGDTDLNKSLMAPNVSLGASRGDSDRPSEVALPVATAATDRAAELMRMARAIREEVEKNFDHVGTAFAEEAKKIHYGETEHRNIFGEMTPDEATDLHEEGVEFGVLPWPAKEDA